MAELVLMKKDFDQMNVPTSKLQQYLDDGWVEVSRSVSAEDKKSDVAAEKKPAEKKAEAKK